ncbi:C-X-C motif chemokine 9 isoform X4 [Prionailurus iriomotensis]
MSALGGVRLSVRTLSKSGGSVKSSQSSCHPGYPSGTLIMRNRRCFCINTSQGTIHLKSLKDLKQFAPSPSCEKTEIIVTMKNGDQTCLNPDSADVKELIKEWEKQGEPKEKAKEREKNSKKQENF